MAKYVAYIPGMDSFLMDGNTPYIDEEKEVKRVIAHETVHPKSYEAKPVSFLKTWAKRQQQKEQEEKTKPYRFSPTAPEFHYRSPEGQARYLLVVGNENESKSGLAVKAFDSRDEAVIFARKSISGLTKELPNLGYYILDTENHVYVDGITAGKQWRIEDYAPGISDRKSVCVQGDGSTQQPKRRGRKPRVTPTVS